MCLLNIYSAHLYTTHRFHAHFHTINILNFTILFPSYTLNSSREEQFMDSYIRLSALNALIQIWSQFSSVQLLSHVRFFVTAWTAARQASLSITNSKSLLKLMSIESVMPSNHLILCHPLLLPHSIFPRIRVFSSDSVLPIRWPKYWSFSFSISPSNEYLGLISFRID